MSLLIDDLHDYALLCIFDCIPLKCLLPTLGQVCARWRQLQWSAFCRRRVLNLVFGMTNLTEEDDDFGTKLSRMFYFNCDYDVQQFVKSFRNVRSLNLLFADTNYRLINRQVVQLLSSRWSGQLIKLDLRVRVQENAQYATIKPLDDLTEMLSVINHNLPLLSLLKLDFGGTHLIGLHFGAQLDLPVIGQLSEFAFYSQDEANILVNSLKSYVPIGTSKRIHLGCSISKYQSLHHFMSFPPAVCQQFTRINLGFPGLDLMEMRSFVKCFSLITQLAIEHVDQSLSLLQLVCELAQLKHLTRLEVRFSERIQKYSYKTHLPQSTLSTLESLSIHWKRVQSHTELDSLCLPQTCPKLGTIKLVLDDYRCAHCLDHHKKDSKCRVQFLAPLSACAYLAKQTVEFKEDKHY